MATNWDSCFEIQKWKCACVWQEAVFNLHINSIDIAETARVGTVNIRCHRVMLHMLFGRGHAKLHAAGSFNSLEHSQSNEGNMLSQKIDKNMYDSNCHHCRVYLGKLGKSKPTKKLFSQETNTGRIAVLHQRQWRLTRANSISGLSFQPRQSPIRQLWKESRNIACWKRFRGVFQMCVERTLEWIIKRQISL